MPTPPPTQHFHALTDQKMIAVAIETKSDELQVAYFRARKLESELKQERQKVCGLVVAGLLPGIVPRPREGVEGWWCCMHREWVPARRRLLSRTCCTPVWEQ